MKDVFAIVRRITARILRVDEARVEMGSRFKQDLAADSINLVEIAMAIEQEFDITLEDDEVTNITTVADAVNYILKRP
ncbi:MAG: acyl carrier protein [Firmicutes bacterium]|nr:acyl carrier protein [Dethiobacter sp.]MBS3888598.1 acyl carrier protein [Bacillota bacterium]MBS4054162.1 acyl carrier protein [Thermaerobacter sp.]